MKINESPKFELHLGPVLLLILLIVVFVALVTALDITGQSISKDLYPVTKSYEHANITERLLSYRGCGYLVSDDGNKYYVCGDIFWNTTPGYEYTIEYTYNLSWREVAGTFGKGTAGEITDIRKFDRSK